MDLVASRHGYSANDGLDRGDTARRLLGVFQTHGNSNLTCPYRESSYSQETVDPEGTVWAQEAHEQHNGGSPSADDTCHTGAM